MRARLGGPLLALALMLGVTAALALVTPRMAVNGGFGYDGKDYASMVLAFRGQPHASVLELHSYRFAPIALVAASGLDIQGTFLWLNLVATWAGGCCSSRSSAGTARRSRSRSPRGSSVREARAR